jgi:hypothetical protein
MGNTSVRDIAAVTAKSRARIVAEGRPGHDTD